MARVLILEPSQEVRELLCHHVRRLGHEPVVAADGATLPSADVAIVEPGDAGLLERFRAAVLERGAIPLVCVSVYPRDGATDDLQPVAYVLKPFTLSSIRAALQQAVSVQNER